MKINRRMVARAALVLVCFLLAGYIVQCGRGMKERVDSHDLAGRAGASLRIGMERTETLQYVGEAWRHYECESSNGAADAYVFGSRNLELAGNLVLRFEKDGDRLVLVRIASVEYYMLNQFDHCKIIEK